MFETFTQLNLYATSDTMKYLQKVRKNGKVT